MVVLRLMLLINGQWISEVAPMSLHVVSKCVPIAGITDCKKKKLKINIYAWAPTA